MAGGRIRRAPKPLISSDLMSAPRHGVVVTDPAGRPHVVAFPEDGDGVALGGDGEFIPVGSGDVVGPAGATDGHLAEFDGATGKLIADSGYSIADLIALFVAGGGTGDVFGPASSTDKAI